ncbi:hypothetical protein [Sporosarcina trichiuri]|uniref:hypothetical protein n=1 Tax=Sporosarcina trichiuri TaxID=3056445 RepID=UPI0025B44640|nr:hypothetical protein [Sporosarcina sp. 0.2-SM1T-5]WJY26294.1 hypothetical protein QWT68_09360 [Sporosarcina sp. 0.2-SM1T-5]
MSWSVFGVFVLLGTWGFTQSFFAGAAILLLCSGLQLAIFCIRRLRRKSALPIRSAHGARHKFLAGEQERIRGLHASGLLTEDEFTEQNRLLSSKNENAYVQL